MNKNATWHCACIIAKSGRPASSPSVARDERAALRAAWERYEATDEPKAPWP